jgi:N-methylhydantoinase B
MVAMTHHSDAINLSGGPEGEAVTSKKPSDFVTFEILRHRLWEINDEMGLLAARVSGSPAVYESGDFNTAILTADGRGLFTGVYVIRQASALDVVVQSVLERFEGEIFDGDMFLTNDPWCGALHAMDYAVVAPVFSGDDLVAWTGIVMHEMDVGGPRPGSWTVGARDAYQECPLMPPAKIIAKGVLRKDIESIFLRNTRTPDVNALNLRAKIASQITTRDRILDVIREYGKQTFLDVQRDIIEHVSRSVRKRIGQLPDGVWYAACILDHDGVDNVLYRMKLALSKRGDRLTFDFRGTAKQAPGPINCARSGLIGGVIQVLFPLLCFDLPWSHGGVSDCFDIISEEGTINNCSFPAATSMATLNAAQSTGNLVWEAMAKLFGCSEHLQDEIIALGYGGANMAVLSGKRWDGRTFVNMFTDSVGGGGARSFADGIDTAGNLIAPSYGIPNVERIEGLLPVLYLYRKERPETAGAGRWRGGVGIEYMLKPHHADGPITAVFFTSGKSHMETKGVAGGMPGSIQCSFILREANVAECFSKGLIPLDGSELTYASIEIPEAKDAGQLRRDDVWICFCNGGGGYGDPLQREPEKVGRDVRIGLCTQQEARLLYGVVASAHGVIDFSETREARQRIRAARFDRGVLPGERWTAPIDRSVARVAPFGEGLSIVEGRDDVHAIVCRACDAAMAPLQEGSRARALIVEYDIAELSPLNVHGLQSDVVVRLYCCPSCGSSFASDVQFRCDDPRQRDEEIIMESIRFRAVAGLFETASQ